MLIKGNNKIINIISYRSFLSSKFRNIIAVIAMILTSILFTSLFIVGSGVISSFQEQLLRQSGINAHVALKYITKEQYDSIKSSELIKSIGQNEIIAKSVDNPEFLQRPVQMNYMDDVCAKITYSQPTTGTLPQKYNEIAIDTLSLDALHISHKVGEKVTLKYTIKDKKYSSDFIISGFWQSDPNSNTGTVIISNAFVNRNSNILLNTYEKNGDYSGTFNAYILFKNNFNIEHKLEQLFIEKGYRGISDKTPYNIDNISHIRYNINWAYFPEKIIIQNSGIFLPFIIGILLILFVGYLINYNIFRISIVNDIKKYSLLKIIGATDKQVKKILNRQIIYISIIAIPLGLLFGFIVGKSVFPLIIKLSDLNTISQDSINPIVFVFSILFSYLTDLISLRRSEKIMKHISLVEGVKYVDVQTYNKCDRHSKKGGKLYRFALRNLTRSKKTTIITIISLSLSLILFNTIYSIAIGLNMNKYLDTVMVDDFRIASSQYFNGTYINNPTPVPPNIIRSIEDQSGFKKGGSLYYSDCHIIKDLKNHEANTQENEAQLFGIDDYRMKNLQIIQGKMDMKQLNTGNYIILGVISDDDNMPYNVGDQISINTNSHIYTYNIAAITKVNIKSDTSRFFYSNRIMLYLPTPIYYQQTSDNKIMNYSFSIDNKFEQSFVKRLNKMQYSISYEQKENFRKQFVQFQNTFITIGDLISCILGFIGILNFINSIFTNIWSRKKEFSTLQSIGMTERQLKTMLFYEGLYYSLFTVIISIIFSILLSLGLLKSLSNSLIFYDYIFTITPLLILIPILIILSICIPLLSYCPMKKQNLVSQLKE